MIEAKGTGYAKLADSKYDYMRNGVYDGWIRQAKRQVEASQGRRVRWFFAESRAAEAAKELFKDAKDLSQIEIGAIPWTEARP